MNKPTIEKLVWDLVLEWIAKGNPLPEEAIIPQAKRDYTLSISTC